MTGAWVKSIGLVADGQYSVALATPDGRRRDYVFTVGKSDIPVVTWSREFAEALGHNMAKARVIYEAVQAVHKACTSEIDIDIVTTNAERDYSSER